MVNNKRRFLIIFLSLLLFLSFFKTVSAGNSDIVLEFFFAEDCSHCEEKKPIIDEIENLYQNNITVYRLSIGNSTNKQTFFKYGFTSTPGVVIKNLSYDNYTILTYEYITLDNLKDQINYHIKGNYSEEQIQPDETKFCIGSPFGEICIDTKDWSLPVLTIVLGAIDSVNPCSFFVLLFLLSLLLHTKSRKKMLLVGGIFIFFSGFIYFLLMIAILFFFLAVEQQIIISVIAGIVALVFGGFNIFGFFNFKKGPSISISKDNKSKLFKQMRKIVKMKSLVPIIIATIILAVSANAVELLCSFNIPFVYTGILLSYDLSNISYYMYIILYNIIYIIPLLILVLIVVFTLGRWKLSEWQGRNLKLFSGIMMFSLGLILIFDQGILKNIFVSLGLLFLSIFVTFIISKIFKFKSIIKK